MSHRMIIAFTLSLVLHGGLLLTGAPGFSAPPLPPPLRASLRPPPDPARLFEPPATESLLKNTLEDVSIPPHSRATRRERAYASPALDDPPPGGNSPEFVFDETPLPPAEEARKTPAASSADTRVLEAAREKLSEYVFYPEQAKRLGIEGTVTLFVELAGDGRVEDVRVVESSGHAILDNAAVKGFYAVGRFPGESGLWDYTFRLE